MTKFRKDCINWAKLTYKESVINEKISDKALNVRVIKCFKELGIYEKPVNGYSCESLPKTEEGPLGVRINYTDVFHNLLSRNKFTPTRYLINLTEAFINSTATDEKLNGFIARGLRTLTSLLREPDFAEIIETTLRKDGKQLSVSLNPLQDAGDHTDVLLNYSGMTYRIWLFQFSDRGLPHDIERVSGKRGELPNGIHVLCPLRTEFAIECDKLSRRMERLRTRIATYNNRLAELTPKAVKARDTLTASISELSKNVITLEQEYLKEKVIAEQELDNIEGWFFYSVPYIERVTKFLETTPSPEPYGKVLDILNGPEKFLGKMRIFEK